jgi:hypothetical protein
VGVAQTRDVHDHSVERIRENNERFREANERIRSLAEEVGAGMERIPFLCECPVEDCVEILHLTPAEYSEVRGDPHHFMTAVGHELAEEPVGVVVSRKDSYIVIDKGEYDES